MKYICENRPKRPKRPKPNVCELYGNSKRTLPYHHWQVKDKKIHGIWIYPPCHTLVHIDNPILLLEKYEKLRGEINETY